MSDITYTATYSPEDNKLRLYPSVDRLPREDYLYLRNEGFISAQKQGLFVAHWKPYREDICVQLAGRITAEQTTLLERAEAKAERLDALAVKRAEQSNSYHEAANRISERFSFGQPILVGHHSERKARRDQKKMHSAMDNAIAAQKAVEYWNWKAEGVERYANMKNCTRTRLNRIKKLLAELRGFQRSINEAKRYIDICKKVHDSTGKDTFNRDVETLVGFHDATPYYKGDSLWRQLDKGTISHQDALSKCLAYNELKASSPNTLRWIQHTLNRLAYERSLLGEIKLFEGDLTPVILQTFARTHGAEKPKAKKTDTGFILESPVDFPLHLSQGNSIELSDSGWCELMQSVGYEVPAPKERRKSAKKLVPLINPKVDEAAKLQEIWNRKAEESKHVRSSTSKVLMISQKVFSANSKGSYARLTTYELDINGNKVWARWNGKSAEPVCRIRVDTGSSGLYEANPIVVIEDKPGKALPIEWPQDNESV